MKTNTKNDFGNFCQKIGRAHKRLRHKLGWRFLYTPTKTLSSRSEIVFIGLNPGGKIDEPTKTSVEKGNAYRVESWLRSPRPNTENQLNYLQQQVCKFYELLATVRPNTTVNSLMDRSLSSNFFPFRSPSKMKLENQSGSLRFAQELWREIFELIAPKLIVTLGNEVRDHVDQLLTEHHAGVENKTNHDCDWSGRCSYRLASTTLAGKKVLLIGLPHLSRFGIFHRENHKRTFAPLVKALKQHLKK